MSNRTNAKAILRFEKDGKKKQKTIHLINANINFFDGTLSSKSIKADSNIEEKCENGKKVIIVHTSIGDFVYPTDQPC